MVMKREKTGTEWKVNGVQRGQSDSIQKVQNTKEIMLVAKEMYKQQGRKKKEYEAMWEEKEERLKLSLTAGCKWEIHSKA